MDIKEALTFDGLKYFYTKYIKPLKTGAFSTVVNNATTTVANTVLDGRMGKTLADKDANLQNQINTLNSSLSKKITIVDIAEEIHNTNLTYAYTGVKVVVPPKTMAILGFTTQWQTIKPSGIKISTSETLCDETYSVKEHIGYPCITTLSIYNGGSDNMNLHIWAKFEGEGGTALATIQGILIKS